MKKTLHLYKPYAHQKAVHDAITRHIETAGRFTEMFQRIFVVKACRQVGKSIMTENELIRFACQYAGSVNGYVAPTYKLCRKTFAEVGDMMSTTGLVESKNATELAIRFTNGSTIKFFSAEQRDNLRGQTMTGILVIDEAAFIPDKIYYDMLSPWVDARKAITLMISSPDFEIGFFYDHYVMGLSGEHNVSSFDFTDYDLSMVRSPQRLEEIRMTVPAQTFRSEYLGLFKRAEGSVFGDFKDCILRHKPESPLEMYWGLDFGTGSGKDYTVLTAFNENREQCFLWRENNMAPLEQINEIIRILNKYKDKTRCVIAEQNSIGKIYLDILRRSVSNITMFTTDTHSKRKMVELMQVTIQNKTIGFMDKKELINEFALYEGKTNHLTKNISFNAPPGFNDDIVMATMLANHGYDRKKNYKFRIN